MPTVPPNDPSAPPSTRGVIFITSGEFFWLTAAVWAGGVCILTLLPYLLVTRVWEMTAIILSYIAFFLAWQPIQIVTQRTLGMKAGFVRMLLFVAAAAALAVYLRQALPSLGAG
jgi:hypothetical protein